MSKEGCLLWQQARAIAATRGLSMDANCPLEASCKGTCCEIIQPQRVEGEKNFQTKELPEDFTHPSA